MQKNFREKLKRLNNIKVHQASRLLESAMFSLLKQVRGFRRRLVKDLVAIVCIFVVVANYKSLVGSATKRGFFCDDESLKYPYRESTVGVFWLYVIGLWLPLLILVACEVCKCRRYQAKLSQSPALPAAASPTARKCLKTLLQTLPAYLSVYNTTTKFLIGFAVQKIFTRIFKRFLGRLRPHFFAVCQPLLGNGLSCAQLAENQSASGLLSTFWTDYQCTNPNATRDWLKSIQSSFPSGHSSLAFYGMAFLALYLQGSHLLQEAARRRRKYQSFAHKAAEPAASESQCADQGPGSSIQLENKTTRPQVSLLLETWSASTTSSLSLLLQLACVFVATFVALSRIVDYKHHWSDVLAGSLQGTAIAAIFVRDCRWQPHQPLQWAGSAHQQLSDSSPASPDKGNNEIISPAQDQRHDKAECDEVVIAVNVAPNNSKGNELQQLS